MKIYNKIKYAGVLVLFFFCASCTEYLTVTPGDQLTDETAIVDINGAYTALYGVYTGMQHQVSYGCNMINFGDLRGGDMQPTARTDSRSIAYYSFNNRTPENVDVNLWFRPYLLLNRANSLIAAMEAGKVTDGTVAQRNDVLGQAYTLRGLFHFDLVKLFGVPYMKDKTAPGAVIADHVITAAEKVQRATVAETYEQAVNDIKHAMTLLVTSKARNDGYINYWAAEALLARVYLYMGEWAEAFTAANDVINGTGVYSLIPNNQYIASWSQPFTTESIFSLVNTTANNPSREALSYVSAPSGYGEIILSYAMLDLLQEDPNDVRNQLVFPDKLSEKNSELRDGHCKKYSGIGGNLFVTNIPIIRLSDIYLIAAEAAWRKTPKDQASADKYLDAIRKRANPNVSFVAANDLEIIKERRKELVHEGHRFYDIMRLNLSVTRTGGRNFLNADEVVTVGWSDHLCVLPIPRLELNVNPGMLPTPGYNN